MPTNRKGLDNTLDVIKSYLVNLGFNVNTNEFNQATKSINDLGNIIQSKTAGMAKNFVGASTAIAGALAGVAVATAGVISKVSSLDMEYQKLALHMWTTKQQAKEMKLALDAMGESAEDVAWIPELRAQYDKLIQSGRQMQTPGDASGQLANMRQIRFEWERMKLEAQYSLEWVAYYLIKYLSGPLKGIQNTLKDFNDKISQTMPQWTEKVARWLTMIINIGKAGVRFMSDMADGIMWLFDQLPKGAQKVVAAFAGIGASLFIFGPVYTIIAGLLLLLEDFYGYLDGRKSSTTLAPIWKEMIIWFDRCKAWTEQTMPDFIDGWDVVGTLVALVKDVLKLLLDIVKDLIKELIVSGALKEIGKLFLDIWHAVGSIGKGLSNVISLVNKLFNIKGHGFISTIVEAVRELAFMGRIVATMLDMIGLAMQGKFSAIVARGSEFMKEYRQHTAHVNGFNNGKENGGGGGFEGFISAISGQESGGNYDAVNGRTGAAGKYQIMPDNWPSWSEQAGLPSGSPMTPENQELVARYKLREYYDKYGAKGAAIAWYAGEGAVDYSEFAKNRKQGNGDEPSMNEYAESIIGRMGESSYSDASNTYSDYTNNAVAAYTPSPSYSNPASSSTMSTGDINFNVSADETQIARSVQINMQDANGRTIARQTRELSGVYA